MRYNGVNGGFGTGQASHPSYGEHGVPVRGPVAGFDGQRGSFAPAAGESSDVLDYAAILRKLWRRKFVVIATVVLGTGCGAAIIARMPPHYVAHALVAIGDPLGKSRLSYGTNQAGGPAAVPDTGTVQTEVEVLKSPQLALDVIRDLSLEGNPVFKPAKPASEEPTTWSRVSQWVFGSQAGAEPQRDSAAELSQTVDNFLARLRVSVPNNSRMVDVAFDSPDARLSMQIANAIVDRYVNKQLESSMQSAQRTSAWLREKITRLQDKVEDAEKAVEQFRSQAGIFSTPDRTPLLLKQMTDVSAELANAQTARAAVEARLSQLRLFGQPGGGGRATSDIVDSPFMRTLDAQQADAEQRLAEASTTLGERNPALTGLRERLRNIQVAKRNEGVRVMASLENDLKVGRLKERALSERLAGIQKDIAEMNRSEIRLRALEREAQADRLVLNNFIGRFKETSQEGDTASQRPDAQIVSYAQLPVNPERPKKGLLILIAGMASLIAGALAVLVIEKADRRIHSLEDIEARLKIAGLGMLPFSKAAQLSPAEAARYGSSYREAAKTVFSGLFLARPAPKVTVVTSALPGEGKTTVALSMAAMAAQSGQRVILVDADFWKNGAGAALGIHSGAGLAELLEGKAELAEAIVADLASGADVILAGTFSRASLLAWVGNLPKLLDVLRDRYDVVVVDAPPILAASEVGLLARHADATVIAVRCASTPCDKVSAALKKLRHANATVVGAVLTMVRENQQEKYAYTDSASRFGSYRPEGGVGTRTTELKLPKSSALPRLSNRPISHPDEDRSSRYALLLLNVEETSTASPRRYAPSREARDRLMVKSNCLAQAASTAGIVVVWAHRERANILPAAWLGRSNGNGTDSQSEMHAKAGSDLNCTWRGGDPFSNWEIDYFLHRKGVTHLFLAGVDSAMSIKQTADSALEKGYRVTFIQDCIFTAHEDRWERVLKDFEAAAAFSIKSDEFADFARAVHRANDPQPKPDEDELAAPSSAPPPAAGHHPSQA